jgi:hypothetical protein
VFLRCQGVVEPEDGDVFSCLLERRADVVCELVVAGDGVEDVASS